MKDNLTKEVNPSKSIPDKVDHKKGAEFWNKTYAEFPDKAGALLHNTDIDKSDIDF